MVARPILLVEDNDDDVMLTRHAVETSEIRNPLHHASTIGQAKRYLTKLVSEQNLPALLVLDLQLPDGTGIELLEWVRSQPPPIQELPALIVTGSYNRTDQLRAERLGAILFLRKPVDRLLLSTAIVHLGLRLSEGQQGSLIEQ